jgi:hypothetical protein
VLLNTLLLGLCKMLRVFDLADRYALMMSLMVNCLYAQHQVPPNH